MMPSHLDKFISQLPLKRNCCYIANSANERLSGGFYKGEELLEIKELTSHGYFAFVFLLKGSGKFTDDRGYAYEISPGSLLFRFPEKLYMIQRDRHNPWLEFAVAVPISLYQSLKAAKIFEENTSFIQINLSVTILEKAIDFIDSMGVTGSRQNIAQAYASLLEFSSVILNSSHSENQHGYELRRSLERAKLIIGSELDKKMSIPREVAKLGLGYESFRKSFRAEYGISPKAYRISRRLDKADAMLIHSDMSIKEIGDSLGYPTDSDFIRQYRKQRKVSPSAYRRSLFLLQK